MNGRSCSSSSTRRLIKGAWWCGVFGGGVHVANWGESAGRRGRAGGLLLCNTNALKKQEMHMKQVHGL